MPDAGRPAQDEDAPLVGRQLDDSCLPVQRASDIEDRDPADRFLIEKVLAQGCSIVAADPKSGKTWAGLSMAVAVASGQPYLGRFDVPRPGPALLMLAEDGPSGAKERLSSICRSQDIELRDLPIDLITANRLRIDDELDQRRLARTVERLQPRFLLLDCWVRLIGGMNSNDAGSVAPILGYLRELQREFDVHVCLVHHARKGSGGSGSSIRGSGDFWAWYDSGVHLRRRGDKISMAVEHRAAPAPEPMTLALVGDDDDLHLSLVEDDESSEPSPDAPQRRDLEGEVLTILQDVKEPLSGVQIRKQLRCKTSTLSAVLGRLSESARIVRESGGWTLSPATPSRDEGKGKRS